MHQVLHQYLHCNLIGMEFFCYPNKILFFLYGDIKLKFRLCPISDKDENLQNVNIFFLLSVKSHSVNAKLKSVGRPAPHKDCSTAAQQCPTAFKSIDILNFTNWIGGRGSTACSDCLHPSFHDIDRINGNMLEFQKL